MVAEIGGLVWVDALMLGVVAVSLAVGLWRGLVFELMSAVGWLVAWACAAWGPSFWSPGQAQSDGVPLPSGLQFVAVFVATLVVWGLLARLLKWVVQATPLSGLDRLLGGVFGLFRALLLLAAGAMVMQFGSWAQQPAWRASQGAVALEGVLRGAAPFLPQALQPWLPGPRDGGSKSSAASPELN